MTSLLTNKPCEGKRAHLAENAERFDDEYRGTCVHCGQPLVSFLIEDDDRRDHWSRWAVPREA